jgi:preprotein translocase SecE subunit
MLSHIIAYFKRILEEVQKIKFPERKEVTSMSLGVVGVIFVCGLFFYTIDFLSLIIINKVIIGI